MNKDNIGVLVGMVLGDGYIKVKSNRDVVMKRHPSPQISFSHSIKQKDYAQYKIDRLNKIFGGNATLRTGTYKQSWNNENYTICYGNKSNSYFGVLRHMIYRNGGKYISEQVLNMLSPEGIAIWFMDDGSNRINHKDNGDISSLSLSISTYCTEQEVSNIINYFITVWNIKFKPAFCKRTKKWYIRANTSNSVKFTELISPYIVDSMQYKLSCVQKLGKHERLEPNEVCSVCGKKLVNFFARRMCGQCYRKQYKNDFAGL